MKKSIKLKYGIELGEIIKDPIKLSIVVQIAFNLNEESGEAVISFPKEWTAKIGDLVVLGLIKHTDYEIFTLTNKKIVDITLKRKPTKTDINNQPLKGAKIIPKELIEYHKIALGFLKLFRNNLISIGGPNTRMRV